MKWLAGKLLRIGDRISWCNPKNGEALPVTYRGYGGPRRSVVSHDGVRFAVYSKDLHLTTKEITQ